MSLEQLKFYQDLCKKGGTMLVAGYGTFITDGLRHLMQYPDDDALFSRQWSWPVKVLGVHKLVGWKRIVPPALGYAIVFPTHDDNDYVNLLVVETALSDLQKIDYVEGYPHLYDRIKIHTAFGDAWMYVPGKQMLETRIKEEDYDRPDDWQPRIDSVKKPLARAKFPVFFTEA